MTDTPMLLSAAARTAAGIMFLAILTIEFGGLFLLRVARGRHEMTSFQRTFARAGHAHAGVLVILALVSQVFADAAQLGGAWEVLARHGAALAAILIPAGFFLSSAGPQSTSPNRLLVLVYAGFAALSVGVAALGLGLLRTV